MNMLKFIDVCIAKASWKATGHRLFTFSFGRTTVYILNVTFQYIFQIIRPAVPISDLFSLLRSVNEPVLINVLLSCHC